MKNCYKHFEKQTWKNNSKLSEKEDSRIKKKKTNSDFLYFQETKEAIKENSKMGEVILKEIWGG